jgi:hypothetical protein
MSEHAEDPEDLAFGGETPSVEVIVYRHGAIVHRELCESEEAAAGVVEHWDELDGVHCVVEDLASKHRPGQILEPNADFFADEDDADSRGRQEES